MLDDRAAIYNLTQTFGGPGTFYVATKLVATQTGAVTKTLTPYRCKRMIKLPRKMIYAASPVGQGGQKPFTFVKEQVAFLLIASDLPKGVTPCVGNYIVYKGQGYTLDEATDSSFAGAYLCRCVKISGDVPKQVIDIVMKDILVFTESLTTS